MGLFTGKNVKTVRDSRRGFFKNGLGKRVRAMAQAEGIGPIMLRMDYDLEMDRWIGQDVGNDAPFNPRPVLSSLGPCASKEEVVEAYNRTYGTRLLERHVSIDWSACRLRKAGG